MFSALILFGYPRDTATFEDHFDRSYRPLLLAIPGTERVTVNRIGGAAKGDPPFYLQVEVQFASEEAMQVGLNSQQGQAMAREMKLFASGGFTVLFSRTAVEER
jgi:uncharacterized protein (TIGR02118 family)